MGTIEAVCVSDRRGIPKSAVSEIVLEKNHGIIGDAHAGPGNRQVSLLPRESIETVKAVLPGLEDGAFAENVITAGVDLRALAVGSRLRLGDEVVLEVERLVKGVCPVALAGHAGGTVHDPKVIAAIIEEIAG